MNSREEIRKKLASFGEEVIDEEEEDEEKVVNNSLEICFINQTLSDDEEDENIMINPCHEDDESCNSISNQNYETTHEKPADLNCQEYDEMKSTIQADAKLSLSKCKHQARRQLMIEQQRRIARDPLKQLLGLSSTEITGEKLNSYNINTLQVSC